MLKFNDHFKTAAVAVIATLTILTIIEYLTNAKRIDRAGYDEWHHEPDEFIDTAGIAPYEIVAD